MDKKKKKEQLKVVVAEFSISMHCNACERTVSRAISKLKGVEKFTTDMNQHRVVITGRIDPQQVLKKLKKKTGKRVQIVADEKEDSSKLVSGDENAPKPVGDLSLLDCCKSYKEVLMTFSDENPNACFVM